MVFRWQTDGSGMIQDGLTHVSGTLLKGDDRRLAQQEMSLRALTLGLFSGQSQDGRTSYVAAQAFQRESSKRQGLETASLSRIGSGNWHSITCSIFYWSKPSQVPPFRLKGS